MKIINNLQNTSEDIAWRFWCSTRNEKAKARVLSPSKDIREDCGLLLRKGKAVQMFNNARNHFVTLPLNNSKFLIFHQISVYILSC